MNIMILEFIYLILRFGTDLILLNDSLREFLMELLVPVNGLSSELSITAFTVALEHFIAAQIQIFCSKLDTR